MPTILSRSQSVHMQAQLPGAQLHSSSIALNMPDPETEPEVSSDSTAGRLDSAANSPAVVQVVEVPSLEAPLPEEPEAESCCGAVVKPHAIMSGCQLLSHYHICPSLSLKRPCKESRM